MEITEADVRRDRATLIQRVQANDEAQQSLGWSEMDGLPIDGDYIRWTDSELSSLFQALHTNTHVTALKLDRQSALQSVEVMRQFVSMLAANCSVRHIELHWCALDGSTLAQGLKQHPMLEHLSLRGLEMTVGDIAAVLTALIECPAVHSLNVYYKHETILPAMTDLCTLLSRSHFLCRLHLSGCGPHGAPLRQLVGALSVNEQLRSLDLSVNELDEDDARSLADMLRKNRSLTTLNLPLNPNIGEAGWRALAGSLCNHRSLIELGLMSCALHGAPLRLLAEALSTNEKLRSLDLSANGLDDDDARSLADMLKKNRTLTKLDLSLTDIGEAGWCVLADALRDNRTLTEIDARSCTIPEEDRQFMDACLRRNKQHCAAPPVLSAVAVGSAPSVEQPGSLPSAPAGCAALVSERASVAPASPSPVVASAASSSAASGSSG
jgi:hypothetical protein